MKLLSIASLILFAISSQNSHAAFGKSEYCKNLTSLIQRQIAIKDQLSKIGAPADQIKEVQDSIDEMQAEFIKSCTEEA